MNELTRHADAPARIQVLDHNDFLRELYQLTCYLHASKSIGEHIEQTRSMFGIGNLAQIMQEREIYLVVISASIKLRLLHDQTSDLPDYLRQILDFRNVGKLWQPEARAEPKDLSLREAANKFIHAESMNFTGEIIESDYGDVFTSFGRKIVVRGVQNKTKWKAIVDMDEFVSWGTELVTCTVG